jgi:hypothetical protein
MIKLTPIIFEERYVEQVVNQPYLYLDQWMWCELADDHGLRQEFITIGQKAKATIMYSFATLVEFARINDPQQLKAIGEIMDSIDYGFSEAEPARVIARERQLERAGGITFYKSNPPGDKELIQVCYRDVLDPKNPSRLSPILTRVKEKDTLEGQKRTYENFGLQLTPLIEKVRQEKTLLDKAKKRYRLKRLTRKRPPYTKDLYSLAIHFVAVNEKMQMRWQEWVDMLHVVVPVSYFDFVLLDARWCHFVRNDCPLKCPDIARVFSKREMDSFLSALADFGTCGE